MDLLDELLECWDSDDDDIIVVDNSPIYTIGEPFFFALKNRCLKI